MFYSDEEKEIVSQQVENIKQSAVSIGTGFKRIPIIRGYGEMARAFAEDQNPLKSAIWSVPAIGYKYAFKQSMWTAATFGGRMFKDLGTLTPTMRWHGALGLKSILGGTQAGYVPTMFSGVTEKIPGFVKKPFKFANDFIMGGEISVSKIMGVGLGKKGERYVDEIIKRVADSTGTGKTVNEAIESVIQNATGRGTAKEAADLYKTIGARYKLISNFATFATHASAIFNAYQVSSAVANIGAGMVRTGYSSAEFLREQTKTLREKVTTADFAGGLSAWQTQPAQTERSILIERMYTSRVNGAMPFGNETNHLGV
jgi:hypothetical protein